MRLDEELYELTLLKGDILHYCQGLIKLLQENAQLVSASFYSEPQEMRTLKIMDYNLENLFIGGDAR